MSDTKEFILVNNNNLARITCVIEKTIEHFGSDKNIQKTGNAMIVKIKNAVEEHGYITIPTDKKYFAFFKSVDQLTELDFKCAVCNDHFRCTAMNRQ